MIRHSMATRLLAMAMVLLSACSSDDGNGEKLQDDATVLTFYVYSPEHPAVTRANTGTVDAETYNERRVSTLQIWVFKTGTNTLVGYLSPSDTDREQLNASGSTALSMVVSQSFGHSPENVDVYILANFQLPNTGLTFDASTTRSQLEAAMMGQTGSTGGNSDPFGLTDLTTSVPTDGLPMSGVLRNQPVTGEAPILRIGTHEEMATVQLVRLVSKVRFVFSVAADSDETLEIKDIVLNGNMIPADEYVFLTGAYDERSSHVTNNYAAASRSLLDAAILDAAIGRSTEPGTYTYKGQTAQVYENLILSGIGTGELTSRGPYYLRETDKQLTGTISYALNGGETRQATFRMAQAGDFSRNHTWVVYAYYYSGFELRVDMAYVRNWNVEDREHEIYNW